MGRAAAKERDPARAVDDVEQVVLPRRLARLLPAMVLEDAVDVGGAVAIAGPFCPDPLLHSLAVGAVEVAGLDRGLVRAGRLDREASKAVGVVPAELALAVFADEVAVGVVGMREVSRHASGG